MKPKKNLKKLSLKKETIAALEQVEQLHIKGGTTNQYTCAYTCPLETCITCAPKTTCGPRCDDSLYPTCEVIC